MTMARRRLAWTAADSSLPSPERSTAGAGGVDPAVRGGEVPPAGRPCFAPPPRWAPDLEDGADDLFPVGVRDPPPPLPPDDDPARPPPWPLRAFESLFPPEDGPLAPRPPPPPPRPPRLRLRFLFEDRPEPDPAGPPGLEGFRPPVDG
ncbi:MAG: hypothetical protein ABSF33_06110 [Acidimicrobiales bacterium]